MQRFDLSWRVRHFVFRHVLGLTAVWFVLVAVGVQWFASAATCVDPSPGQLPALGSILWRVPDFGGAP